jgi:O-antigen/teichoic acid export membrane protein
MRNATSARGAHRLLAYVFTATVLANVISAVLGGPDWVGYLALLPLVIMMVTGWYLLWLPHGRRRTRARPGAS